METSDNLKSNHIDKSVIFLFIAAILITASVFGYKYTNYTPCEVIDFKTDSNNYEVGEIIRFRDNTRGAIKRIWDFGDGSQIQSGISPNHYYEKPGKYNIKLIVNGQCEGFKTIEISEKKPVFDSTQLVSFAIPAKIRVGEKLKPVNETIYGEKWEWRFGDRAGVDSKEKNPTHTYSTRGVRTVTLIVDGNSKRSISKRIEVLPKKEASKKKDTVGVGRTPPPIILNPNKKREEFRAPDISEADFMKKLNLVEAREKYKEDFTDYFCGEFDRSVYIKGKTISFEKLCEHIRNKKIKAKRIESIKLYRDKKDNCITHLEIGYKGWLQSLFD
ncbi:PKD domain-containing protein [Aquimarina algicola]|uniref:PKD domain-containing protein n=1 Tax=Aquimarina algicola TaxID=2589995 RepID=A0A504J0M4_9FLAO|nr:PKD domain-containing protein [Aquimarina algicola]TPN81243.1 PKD domain-containing protein [Aquimarina algicola]